MSTDNTPTIDEFRPVVLAVLADGEPRRFRQLCDLVADAAGLTAQTRREILDSGQPRFVNRIGWACSSMTKAGLLDRPKRATYRITSSGFDVAQRHLPSYTDRDLLEWRPWREYQSEVAARRSGDAAASAPVDEAVQESDPVEVLAALTRDFNAQVETDLRQRLQKNSPEFFEKAVIDLLWAMGYGGDYGEKQHVGRSGDGGIDGIIHQDALGLTNVYIQAKRYADTNRVGEPEIRNFIGSLDAQGANLGVFITTSTFLDRAKVTAAGYRHGRIVLIDGLRLTKLMLAYGVGVEKAHEFTLYSVDEDYFEEDMQ
ncbi:restriction endonuclease [Dermabacter sp. HMSC08H10]|uniref:restriction endonuclease n=1 Tax=Dermabacter sp. HMSC08H10 TaxID=1581144 RepID=UPI0008A3D259|nr:restriction endonuclease [Dermabacter sp. HMSC08H10]OFT21608.1 restriction endonuclease [Dermabacter sp. HMSC08H10]